MGEDIISQHTTSTRHHHYHQQQHSSSNLQHSTSRNNETTDTNLNHLQSISQEKRRSRSASWSDHVSTKEGDIVYETSGERDAASIHHDNNDIDKDDDDLDRKTPRTQVLDRHIRSLSGHFQDATKLSPDNSITYSPEPDDPPYFAEQHQEKPITYPLQERVDPYDIVTVPTLGKHRRGPSSGTTNPVMAHRRMDSGGHAAFVQRESGGYSQTSPLPPPPPQMSQDPYHPHPTYPSVPSPTTSGSWEQPYPVAKSSPSHYTRDSNYGHPPPNWPKRSTPPRSTSPYYHYAPQPPMVARGHYRDPSPPISSHRPMRDTSPYYRDSSSYNGTQRSHYRDSSPSMSQGQYRNPTPPSSRGYYSDPSPPPSGYYRQPSPPNEYLHQPPTNVPSPQMYAAPQYEPFTYSPDPYHPQHSSQDNNNNYDGSGHPVLYGGKHNITERKFPSYPPPHPLADHKPQAHSPEYRRQASYSSIGSHESKLEIEETLNLNNKEISPLHMSASINSNSHSRISPQMFMSTLNDPTLTTGLPPDKMPLQHSLDSVDRHRKQSSLTNSQMKKFIHDVGISNRTDRADSAGSFIRKHDRAYSGETFTIGDGLFGEDLLEAPNTPHSLGSISHSSHRESRPHGPMHMNEANRMYVSSNNDFFYADLGSAPAYYQPPPSTVQTVPSNPSPTMNSGHNSSVSLYSQVSSTSDANTDVVSNAKKSGSKRARRKCIIEGCTNRVVQGGRCITHGAQRKKCGHPGCNKNVKKAGMCSTHGPPRKLCDSEGCQKVAVQGGKCISHGAKKKFCNVETCKKQAILNGMCKKHHDLFESGLCLPVQAKDGSGTKNSSTETKQGGHTRGLSAFGDINTVNSIIEGGLGYSHANDASTLGVWKS